MRTLDFQSVPVPHTNPSPTPLPPHSAKLAFWTDLNIRTSDFQSATLSLPSKNTKNLWIRFEWSIVKA